MRDRAVAAYVKGGQDSSSSVLSTRNPMQAARRARFLEQSNQQDERVVHQLAALRQDLDANQTALKSQREEQQAVKERLAAKNDQMQQQLAEASRARDA